MDETKYLKKLKEQNKLPELLRDLSLPTREVETSTHKVHLRFLVDSLRIGEWKNFPAYGVDRTDFYEMNDYGFLSGIRDCDQKKLSIFVKYMKNNFDTYEKDYRCFWGEQLKKKQEELQAECDKKKKDVECKIGEKIRVLDGKKQSPKTLI